MAAGRAKAKTKGTKKDWDEAILRFRFFRHLEEPAARERAEDLPGVLARQADAIYELALDFERTGRLDGSLARYNKKAITARLRDEGYDVELRDKYLTVEFVAELPAKVAATPRDIRWLGHTLKNASDRADRLIKLYLECVEWIRERTTKSRGGNPSVSGYWLIRTTDQWCASINDIAKQLAKRGIDPGTDDDEDEAGLESSAWEDERFGEWEGEQRGESKEERLRERWEVILKKVRSRAHRRGSRKD